MTADELIAAAAACTQCGEEHQPRLINPDYPLSGETWGSPDDGHAYRPQIYALANVSASPVIVALRRIAAERTATIPKRQGER